MNESRCLASIMRAEGYEVQPSPGFAGFILGLPGLKPWAAQFGLF